MLPIHFTHGTDSAQAFAALVQPGAHSLILGSAPGRASLQAQRYYAHPRNAFWPIMRTLLGLPDEADYAQACAALTAAGFALWDVLANCQRRGSLDADIRRDSIQINDFSAFFAQHPSLERVFFNGSTAQTLFLRHALPTLGPQAAQLTLQRLPSTSPAHARMCFADKLQQWHQALLIR